MVRDPDEWRGVLPSLCTPFDASEAIDLEVQRRVVRFALESGAHGLVCFGLAGEIQRLAEHERAQLLEVISAETSGAVPLLVGVGGESLTASLRLARHAVELGAHGVIVPPPLGDRIGSTATAEYVARVADAAGVPTMVQDAPDYLGAPLTPAIVREAAALAPNVSFVKLESSSHEVDAWMDDLPNAIGVWTGAAGMHLLDCLRTGVRGVIPGPELVGPLVRIYELERAGRSQEADAEMRNLLPLLAFENQSTDHCNACAKRILGHRGVLSDVRLRSPSELFRPSSARLLKRHLETAERLGVFGREAAL